MDTERLRFFGVDTERLRFFGVDTERLRFFDPATGAAIAPAGALAPAR